MGIKLLWVGLTMIQVGNHISTNIPSIQVVGSVIMIIGCILMLLDK